MDLVDLRDCPPNSRERCALRPDDQDDAVAGRGEAHGIRHRDDRRPVEDDQIVCRLRLAEDFLQAVRRDEIVESLARPMARDDDGKVRDVGRLSHEQRRQRYFDRHCERLNGGGVSAAETIESRC